MFQIITTFSVVDNMKEQFYAQQGKISRFDILAITSPVFLLLYDFFFGSPLFLKMDYLSSLDPGKMIRKSRSFLMTLKS